jgi:hypothetical protein
LAVLTTRRKSATAKLGNDDLKTLLATKYTKKVKNYWPFESVNTSSPTSTSSTQATTEAASHGGGNSLPSYLPPLLGAILGVLVVIAILGIYLFWRRRNQRMRHLASDSGASTMVKRRRTWSWLGGVNSSDKPAHDDSTEYGLSGERKNPLDATGQSAYEPKTMVPVEADPQNTIFELPG